MNPLKKAFEYYLSQKRHRGKSRLVKCILKTLPFSTIRSHYGVILACNVKDKTNIYAISGDYGHIISGHIKTLENDSVFLDIGANYGLFSNLAARKVKEVYSFEPNPVIFEYLETAKKANKAKNINLFPYAIGTENRKIQLTFNQNHSGLSHISEGEPNEENLQIFDVNMIDITSHAALSELEKEEKIHIKIDVEGFEAIILKAIINASWFKNIKSLIVEIDEKNLQQFGTSRDEIYKLMHEKGLTPSINGDASKHYDEIFIRQ